LWGPEAALIERVSTAVRAALPGEPPETVATVTPDATATPDALAPRVGIAGTHFAATIAAVHARPGSPVIVPPGEEAAFLADFPSALLTAEPDVRARLTRFGLRRIGAVAELPRSALIARFGDEGARLHARGRGEETEPFRARHAHERLALAVPIEPPVEDLEPLRFVLHRLVGALAAQLTGRGLAADRAVLALELDLAFAPVGTPGQLDVEQRFPEPTADGEAIERLLFARLEREPPPAAVARLDLELRGTTPAAGQQLPLFVPQAARTARLGWQLARLALTYGEDRVRRVAITDPEAPLPEDRWSWQGVGLDDEPAGVGRRA
jgi:protein ImuB